MHPNHYFTFFTGEEKCFQFFPSCIVSPGHAICCAAPAFNSFPVASELSHNITQRKCYAFNSFPVASIDSNVDLSEKNENTFNSFPVASHYLVRHMRKGFYYAFNSFPVASGAGQGDYTS
ncbi:MAG: hypothetical protein N3E41_08680 [Thermofilaceae archaeon]|nr:hypothetical protein [Thermofilaceae archaeon]